MAFRITYRRLFSVEILHDYFLNRGSVVFEDLPEVDQVRVLRSYSVPAMLDIRPTLETDTLLRDRGLVFRTTATGFFVGVRLNDAAFSLGDERPDLSIDESMSFRFSARAIDPYFLNYTSLPLHRQPGTPYYFSNANENELHLSSRVADFDSSVAYEAGDVHVDNQSNPTELFEAIQQNGPGARNDADWVAVEPVRQYATFQDRIRLRPARFSVSVSKSGAQKTSVEILRPGDTSPILTQEEKEATELPTFSVDLSDLAPGRYELRVKLGSDVVDTESSGLFYLDQALFDSRLFGLFEIIHDAAGASSVQLVDPTNQDLFSPAFTLRFKNRQTFWRYIFNRDQTPGGFGELEPDPLPGIDPGDERRRFRTRTVKPLTEAVEELARFDSATELLPNPTVALVKPDANDDRIYSETFMPI